MPSPKALCPSALAWANASAMLLPPARPADDVTDSVRIAEVGEASEQVTTGHDQASELPA